MKKSKASDIAILSILIATIIVIQALSTYIYAVWPIPIQPTFASVPVIVGACLLGWKRGAFLGFAMGLILFVQASITPGATNFLFTPAMPDPALHGPNWWSIVVTFVPRILIGLFAGLVYKVMKNRAGAGLAGLVGAATNTVFVLGFIFLFFKGTTMTSILALIISWNSLVEVAAAAILTSAIVPILEKSRH
ncbi:MAG: ECF transporter S component [Streptococcaceae bacterium]|nr:ECF transporter S component [Streptococcaceae bacterium]